MAVKKEIIITADTSDAVKNVDRVADALDNLAKEQKKANEINEKTAEAAKKGKN